MTDNAEIERLLNMTGRTLEGLPKSHAIERIVTTGRSRGTTPYVAGKTILHQSDVIELLVDALRDALEGRESGKKGTEGNERTNEIENNRI